MGSRSETFAESTFRAIKCGQNAGKIQTRLEGVRYISDGFQLRTIFDSDAGRVAPWTGPSAGGCRVPLSRQRAGGAFLMP